MNKKSEDHRIAGFAMVRIFAAPKTLVRQCTHEWSTFTKRPLLTLLNSRQSVGRRARLRHCQNQIAETIPFLDYVRMEIHLHPTSEVRVVKLQNNTRKRREAERELPMTRDEADEQRTTPILFA